jgi:hypothetical protein
MPTPTPSTPPTFSNSKAAKAEARAAHAHAKALRPWYKRKRWILSIGFIVLVVIAGAAGSSSETSYSGSASSDDWTLSPSERGKDTKDDETTGTAGEPVTNAGMTYEVTSVDTSSSLGDTRYGLGTEADGKSVVVDLELTNNKDETKTFSESTAKIVTTDGKSYASSSEAIMGLGDDGLFLKDVQPDLTTSGKMAFDLPPAKIPGSKLVINDLFGRGEITVDLGL